MQVVYNGYDNDIKIRVSEVAQGIKRSFDFTAVSSVQLQLPDIPMVISSGIDFSEGNGVLRLSLGDDNIPVGKHKARLVVYDAQHPSGQVLIHEDVHNFWLRAVS